MRLPKELITVTTTSKLVALIMFFVLPVIGFFLGIQYQKSVPQQSRNSRVKLPPVARITHVPPDTEHMYTDPTNSFTFSYPSNFWVEGGIYEPYGTDELLISVKQKHTVQRTYGFFDISTQKTSGLDTFLDDIYELNIGDTWNNAPTYTRIADTDIGGLVAHTYIEHGQTRADVEIDNSKLSVVKNNGKYFIFNYGYQNMNAIPTYSPEYGTEFPKVFDSMFASFQFKVGLEEAVMY